MRTPSALLAALALSAGAMAAMGPASSQAAAPDVTQVDLVSPVTGDEKFGESVTVLPNGNYIVTDPGWDNGAVVDVGAVYLYDGATNAVISTLTGTTTTDQVGSGGVIVLTNGNYIVKSPLWNAKAGAATWGDATTGVSGPVSTTNSLHGTQADDEVGGTRVIALTNGNYVVTSRAWDNGTIANAGAATWGNGTTGISGPVATTNSLYGTHTGDSVGGRITALTNGNYVVISQFWDNGVTITNAGAATWGNGSIGRVGPVNTANSLHGTQADDQVGADGVIALTNGNYVVSSPRWNNGAIIDVGAVTWADGTGGTTGAVTTTNSLHGTQANDAVANRGAVALANGNYVVQSLNWNNGAIEDAGAATWGDGNGGTIGAVTTTNSLHGTTLNDMVTDEDVVALTNGNYVVRVPTWDNGLIVDAGAATWGDGTAGTTGPVTTTNSLHGTQTNDMVGDGPTAVLANGNYVVQSAEWDNGGTANVGAATWGNGATGITGPVTTTNSLHGTQTDDGVAGFGLYELTNGNYLVNSSAWDNGSIVEAGAVTWGNGTTGITGPVTTTNSLHGTQTNDMIGNPGITILTDGNYVVRNSFWDNGSIVNAGAATWGSGVTGISGPVTTTNSLHGTQVEESVANGGVTALVDGDYVVTSRNWDSATVDAGAATFGPSGGVVGPITTMNSAIGTPPGAIEFARANVTTSNAVAVPTSQDRVVLMQLLPTPPPSVTSLDPERFVDTRPIGETLDDQFEAAGVRQADSEYPVQIGGRGQVPADAKAAVVNVTAIQPGGDGFVTAHPCVTPRPLASSLNYTTGINLGNEIIAPLSATGELCLYTSAGTHLAVDVVGYIDVNSPTTPTTPARFLDTRPAGDTIDDVAQRDGRANAGSTVTLPVAGRGDVPADAAAVIVNVTAVQASGTGFITVHACLPTAPNTASLNYTSSANRGNELIAQVDSSGNICLFTSAETHLTADVVGYLPAGTKLTAIAPSRLLDTRATGTTIDSQQQRAGKQPADTQTRIPITNRAGIPSNATTVVLNVTAVQPDTNGFITIHPCQTPAPNTASLNYTVGVNGGNEIVTRLHTSGDLCVYTSATTHLTIDVVAHTV